MPSSAGRSGSFERPLEEAVAGEAAELVSQERRPVRRGEHDRVVEEPGHRCAPEAPPPRALDEELLPARSHRDALDVVRAALAAKLDVGAERRAQPSGHEPGLVLGPAHVNGADAVERLHLGGPVEEAGHSVAPRKQPRPRPGPPPTGFEASKSRTFAVPLVRLYRAFHDSRTRARWLPGVALTIRTATRGKSMRITWPDRTSVEVGFMSKGTAKSQVALAHTKLPDRAAQARVKQYWGERLDALGELLSGE